MKHTMKRALALLIAVLLAMPTIAASEELAEPPVELETSLEAAFEASFEAPEPAPDLEQPVDELDTFALDDQEPGPIDVPPVPFGQSVNIDGVTIALSAGAGVFPEGASLRVSAAADADIPLAVERALGGGYVHHQYHVAVVGPDGAAISPDHAQGVPMVRVAGIDAAERPSVAMLDGYDVLVIGADVFDGELAFE